MNRTRDYYRKMRAKHIKRKKKITYHYGSFRDGYPYYTHDGMFSKNKIHCSCPLCKEKAYFGKHMPTLQEKRKKIDFREEIADSVDIDGNPLM